MKTKLIAMLLAPFLLAGCASMSTLSENKAASGVRVEDNAKALASYYVVNHSYKLFGCVPLSTGVTWKGGDDYNGFNTEYFSDRCTVDENLASVKAAAKACKSDRIASLITTVDTSWAWSLFLVKHTEIKTSCVICAPDAR
ncbi:MAG: hypothetical protein IKQ15_01825 [Kiritimatiellae bacterium]|nr:hypothetical protein [Kiritimatiellia bacterium]